MAAKLSALAIRLSVSQISTIESFKASRNDAGQSEHSNAAASAFH
jgi:hypothetical protein